MKTTAKDVMITDFKTLNPDSPISDALKIFKASKVSGKTIFGIMVIDKDGSIAGMISMYDVLLFLLPKHVKIWGNISDIEIEGIIDRAAGKLKNLFVGDIMTPKIISVTPDTHLMMILDIMIKKHVRRLPVISNGTAVGMVYISDLFNHLLERV
ncbi:MAG: CBS domain-containing protein [Desulfobacula sp.]|uniref:CBS domain-containing protein n=1 Tax=Desulfobacula sp. TaxID=2593537 RepID=UPI0025C244B3|nr:CBS domain-containing protein [Desulfobacula sp.]MCD4718254.1 CBS domain-containing protein [Desulfobacula sp.]